MKKEIFKKVFVLNIIVVVLVFFIILLLVKNNDKNLKDSIIYKGEKYICLEYNMDIFTYNFYSNNYYEEDIIHPIFHDKWDMVYFNGDLFVSEKEYNKAKIYYSNDKNYDWFIVSEENDIETIVPISLDSSEKEYIYNMDNMKKSETKTFEEIKKFADLTKISKDNKVFSLISLAYYEDSWYWKTEIMADESREYVIKLPDSLNQKIPLLFTKVLNYES